MATVAISYETRPAGARTEIIFWEPGKEGERYRCFATANDTAAVNAAIDALVKKRKQAGLTYPGSGTGVLTTNVTV